MSDQVLNLVPLALPSDALPIVLRGSAEPTCIEKGGENEHQTWLHYVVYYDNFHCHSAPISEALWFLVTVKILKIGTPEIITIIVLQLEQLDFTLQYCV